MVEQMSAVPAVRHVPRTASSYPFAAADHARVPLDLASYGYVEEEFFLFGYANVYTKASGELAIERTAVPYTNRILVRHPAQQNWRNRSQYLAKQRAFDNRLRQEGYLTSDGQALFAERANLVLDLIGIDK